MDNEGWLIGGTRRLPVFLLLDASTAMQGTAIVAANTGIQLLHQALTGDEHSANIVHLSVISCAAASAQRELSPLDRFTPPQLAAGGGCAFGAGLATLEESLELDIIPALPHRPGDRKPVVFALLAGAPADVWQPQADALARSVHARTLTVLACALDDAAEVPLRALGGTVLRTAPRPEQIHLAFQWLAGTVMALAHAADNTQRAHQVHLPPLPAGFSLRQ